MKKIFLSSKFDEFTPLRQALSERLRSEERLFLINLQENKPDSRSVGELSVSRAVEADIFVLLIGETYGTPPAGHRHSYTHQEYLAAINAFESPDILPFAIGPSYSGGASYFGEKTEFDLWRNQLFQSHKVCTLLNTNQIDEIVNVIVSAIWNSILRQTEASTSLLGQMAHEVPEDSSGTASDVIEDEVTWEVENIADEDVLSLDEEVRLLEKKDKRTLGSVLRYTEANLTGQFADSIAHRSQAEQALKMGLYKVAENHLRHALDIRGLDFLARDLLSRVLGIRNDTTARAEAVQECIMAARIAADRQLPFRAASLYLRGSDLADDLGRTSEAVKFARAAQTVAPAFMQPRVRLALLLYKADPKLHELEIRKELGVAFNAMPGSVSLVDRDPAFKELRLYIDELRSSARMRIDKNLVALSKELGRLPSELIDALGTSKPVLEQYLTSIQSTKSLNAKSRHVRTLYRQLIKGLGHVRSDISHGDMVTGELQISTYKIPQRHLPARLVSFYCQPGDLIEPGQAVCQVETSQGSTPLYSHRDEAFVVGKFLVEPGALIEDPEVRQIINIIPESRLKDTDRGMELKNRLDMMYMHLLLSQSSAKKKSVVLAVAGSALSLIATQMIGEGYSLIGVPISLLLGFWYHKTETNRHLTSYVSQKRAAFKNTIQTAISTAHEFAGLSRAVVQTLADHSLPSFANVIDSPRKAKPGSLLLLSRNTKGFEKKVLIQKTRNQLHGLDELSDQVSLFKVVEDSDQSLVVKKVA